MTPPTDLEKRTLISGVLVGAFNDNSARVWAHTPQAGPLDVSVRLVDQPDTIVAAGAVPGPRGGDDNTCVFTIPHDLAPRPPDAAPLRPLTRYMVTVEQAGALVGQAWFETAPGPHDALDSFSFGVVSCHQPFDDKGELIAESVQMLQGTRLALRQRDAKFVLLLGDQIYADHPPGFSLFEPAFFARVAPPGRERILDCTRAEIRALYQQRHRIFLGVEDFFRMLTDAPTYPTLDDHEIRDNFGAVEEHAGPPWSTLRAGAIDAFHDYQASRVADFNPDQDDFHFGFTYGPCAVFVMDVRSRKQRFGDTTHPYPPAQLASLERFLAANAHKPVLVLATSVPIVYIERWLADAATAVAGEGSDAADRWNTRCSIGARDRVLRVLRAHQLRNPAQRVLLLGGDIHVGCAFRVDWDDGGPPLFQFTSSALSNYQGRAMAKLAELVPMTTTCIEVEGGPSGEVHLLEGQGDARHNPYGGLNAGVVHVSLRDGRALLDLELLGLDEAGPATLFRSGPL